MTIETELNAMWNGASGNAWVDEQPLLDRMFAPFEAMLVEAATAHGATRVLDIGCGTGATTLAMARAGDRRCTGVDISEPMIALARQRAEQENARADFICADAAGYDFEPAGFDLVTSRFGVMFFADPIAAFANLRRAATVDAGMACIVWRSGEENPFMTAAEQAVAPLLPGLLPPRTSDEPGQFGFADRDRVSHILAESGWDGVDMRPVDVECAMTEADHDRYSTRLGPLGRVFGTLEPELQARVRGAVHAAFAPYMRDGEVRFTAACWMIAR